MDVDGEMESGVRVRDGSEGDAMVVSSLSVIVCSLCCASWMSEAESKLLLRLRVLSLSSSISSGALAYNGLHVYCELFGMNLGSKCSNLCWLFLSFIFSRGLNNSDRHAG